MTNRDDCYLIIKTVSENDYNHFRVTGKITKNTENLVKLYRYF